MRVRDTPCYIGRRPGCGHIVGAIVDDGKRPRDVAKFVADMVRDGLTIERTVSSEARVELWCDCDRAQRELFEEVAL